VFSIHDELFKDDVSPEASVKPAAKEVLRYRQALRVGFKQVRPGRDRGADARPGALRERRHLFCGRTADQDDAGAALCSQALEKRVDGRGTPRAPQHLPEPAESHLQANEE